MALNVADLIATLGLNTEGFRKGAEEAAKLSQQVGKSTTEAGASASQMGVTMDKAGEQGKQGLAKVGTEAQKTGKSLSDLITPANLAAAAIGTALAASLKNAVSSATQFADEIHKLQLLTGSTTRDIAALIDVANDVGAEFGQVKMALLRLANQGQETDNVLSQLGLTAKDGVGRFLQAAQAISTIEDANQRAAVTSEIFGARVAADLLPVIDRLRNGTKDLGAETNEFANILGTNGVAALRDFGIAEAQVGDAVLQLKIVVAKDLLPVLNPLVAGLQKIIELFIAIPAPVRAAIEVLGLAAGAIGALNIALKLFGVTTLAMTGPAGWIALAVAGFAVLVTSIDGLTDKLSRAWELFKLRGMVAPEGSMPSPSAATTQTPKGPGLVIIPKDVLEANKAIQAQIDTLKAQRIELESGAIAALKYGLAHGEMAKASPKLKAELIALTQGITDFKAEQELATKTLGDATDELREMKKKEKELAESVEEANAAIKIQSGLFIDAGRYADELREDVDGVISLMRELSGSEKERIDLLVRLKQLSPAEALQLQSKAIDEAIAGLKRYKVESLSAFDSSAQVVKDVDREILKLQADQAGLVVATQSWGSAFKDVFEGALGILSLFGVKIGRVILLLQNLPQALGGLQKMFAGINSLASLAGIAVGATIPGTAAAAVADLGKAAGVSAENLTGLTGVVSLVERALTMFGNGLMGILGFFGNIVSGIASGSGIVNTLTTAFGGLVKSGGALYSIFNGLSNVGSSLFSVFTEGTSLANVFQTAFNALGLTSGGFGAGVGTATSFTAATSATGGAPLSATALKGDFASFLGEWVPIAGALYMAAMAIQNFLNGDAAVKIGTGIGLVIAGPFGAYLGGIIGGMFSPQPKAKLSASITPFDRNAIGADVIGAGGLPGTQVGAGLVNISGNIMKNSKERELQLALAGAINHLLVQVVDATVMMIKTLPPTIGAQLDAALTDLETHGLTIDVWSHKGKKAAKRFKQHVEALMGDTLQALTVALDFGDVDLKALGFDPKDPKGKKGGEVARGFEGMMMALGGLSAIVKEVGPAVDLSSVSLAQFTKGAIDLFKGFATEGEVFTDTIKRVMQTFGEIIALKDQIHTSLAAISSDMTEVVSIIKTQMANAEANMVSMVDALTVAIESGAKPEEVLAAAKAATEAVIATLKMEIDAVTAMRDAVVKMNTAITDGVDLIVSLTAKIDTLRGASADPAFMQTGIAGIVALFNQLTDVTSRISLFASGLALLSESTEGILGNIPLVTAGFNQIMSQIQEMTNPTEAITALKGFAGAVESGLNAGIAGINRQTQARIAGLNAERSAIGQNTAAAKSALEAQKTAINEQFNAQKAALQTALSLSQQWVSVLQSVKAQLVDLFNLLAPTHPLTSLNEIQAQFNAAFAAFQASPTAEGATGVQDLAKQLLQLAQQTPGYDLPSADFQALAATVRTALESIQTFAASQPSQEAIQAQIAALEAEQAASLANIDTQIQALDANQAAALASIDYAIQQANAGGQAQIQQLQDLAAQGLEAIRAQLVIEVTALAAEQAKAAEALQAVLGDKSYEQFIAEKQAEAADLLRGIDRTLQAYLGAIITNLFPGTGVPQLAGGMDYVPSNRFPAYLDRGERVLTASENRAYSNGSGGSGKTTVNLTLANTIQIQGGSSSQMKSDLDKALVELVNGPSLTRPALLELAKRAS